MQTHAPPTPSTFCGQKRPTLGTLHINQSIRTSFAIFSLRSLGSPSQLKAHHLQAGDVDPALLNTATWHGIKSHKSLTHHSTTYHQLAACNINNTSYNYHRPSSHIPYAYGICTQGSSNSFTCWRSCASWNDRC